MNTSHRRAFAAPLILAVILAWAASAQEGPPSEDPAGYIGETEKNLDRLIELVEKADAKRAEGFSGPAGALYDKAIQHASESFRKPGPEVIHWTTRAHFGQTELAFQSWRELRLEGPLDTLKQRIREKTTEMQAIGPRYQKLLASGELEWQAAGLCRLGALFHRYGAELRAAACPEGMDAEACHAFTEQMAVAAGEMETEARQYYEATRDLLDGHEVTPDTWERCWEQGLETLGRPAKYGAE